MFYYGDDMSKFHIDVSIKPIKIKEGTQMKTYF